MRVWDCDPRLLADKHLRAQHAEIHFAIRVIENAWKTRWKDVERFRRHPEGLTWLGFVHDATVEELQRRGKFANHRTSTNLGDRLWWLHGEARRFGYGREWMQLLTYFGYPPTELNQGTPWERDGVSFDWYREHEQDWTRALARDEASNVGQLVVA